MRIQWRSKGVPVFDLVACGMLAASMFAIIAGYLLWAIQVVTGVDAAAEPFIRVGVILFGASQVLWGGKFWVYDPIKKRLAVAEDTNGGEGS